MKRCSMLAVVTLTLSLFAAACTSDEDKPAAIAPASAPTAAAPAAADEARPVKIPTLEGYKYYVGGPVMRQDPYGRHRISDFQGEVQQPPSRGMVFGVKRDGDRWEYRVWGNGKLLGVHKGLYRDRCFWPEYVEGYRNEKLVAREYFTNDDAAKRSKLKTEDIDPETGEVIRVKESSLSYLPMKMPAEFEDNAKPAAPAPAPTPPPAPAAE